MSTMLEVCCREPVDTARENRVTECVVSHGGQLDYREAAEQPGGAVCLTFEFSGVEQAEAAAAHLRIRGEHVEVPADYGL